MGSVWSIRVRADVQVLETRTHMINLPGCTEPASGLYEAREIPYEVHRIRSAV